MSSLELKEKLIRKIESTQNDLILEELYRLLEPESEDSDVYILNNEQKGAIDEARMQVKNGQYLSEEEADKEIDEWLNQ